MGIERYGIDKSVNSMAGLSAYENGGPGSGDFGHAGRPGQVGGSAASGGKGSSKKSDKKSSDDYVPGVFTGLRDVGDSARASAKEMKSILEDTQKDTVELTRRQYGETHAKNLDTEFERAKETLSMLADDWVVDVRRANLGMLETKFLTKYKVGDRFTLDGEEMTVVPGDKPGTIMGVSKDNKQVSMVPDERLFSLAQVESETVLDKKNYDTIRRIAEGGSHNEKETAEKIIDNIEKWSKKKK